MTEYVDAWRGFSVRAPQGWSAVFPPVEGVAFVPPDGAGFLELAAVETGDAADAVRERLAGMRAETSKILSGSPERAATAFADQRSRGEIHARVSGGRTLVVLAQLPTTCTAEPHTLVADLIASLSVAEPIRRTRWTEPTEGAFTLLLPDGWQVQSALRPSGAGRDLLARVSRDPRTFVAIEPAMGSYVAGPPRTPFDRALPLQPGLPALVQQAIGPGLTQEYGPGVQLLGHDVWTDPLKPEVRFALPDGSVRVLMLAAFAMPGMANWIGGISAFFQAPADELPGLEAVLRGVIASARTDPQWQARDQGLRQQVYAAQRADQQGWLDLQNAGHAQRMNDIAAAGRVNTAIHQQRMATADAQFAGWQQRQDGDDQIHHDTVNAVRGVSDYLDPSNGQVYAVADGYEGVWTDQQGRFVAADRDLDPPVDWTELRRLAPGEWHDR